MQQSGSKRHRVVSYRSTLLRRVVWIGEERVRVNVFVARLGYSRRILTSVPRSERGRPIGSRGWRARSFALAASPVGCCRIMRRRWSNITTPSAGKFVLIRDCTPSQRYWGFTLRAYAPHRARTKESDERGVGYVKKNAIAGRRFESWAAFERIWTEWVRDVADQREHGTTGVAPADRFAAEAGALRPLAGRARARQLRDLVRKSSGRLRHRPRHEQLFGTLASDRRRAFRSGYWQAV